MKKVISMSRRTDMYWHADKLIKVLQDKYPPEKVHSLVCWTKFPQAVYKTPYRNVLKQYDQVYVQLTVTGLGGTPLEPSIPRWEKALDLLPELVEFLGTPRRIRLRPDPLVAVKNGARVITNIKAVEKIISRAAEYGITAFTTSFMEVYPKVQKRLQKYGYTPVYLSPSQKEKIIGQYKQIASTFGGKISTCCVPGFPVSACIDGEELAELHPYGEACSFKKARGQRNLCGCTESIDIGWYSMSCPSGCLYCYANPRV